MCLRHQNPLSGQRVLLPEIMPLADVGNENLLDFGLVQLAEARLEGCAGTRPLSPWPLPPTTSSRFVLHDSQIRFVLEVSGGPDRDLVVLDVQLLLGAREDADDPERTGASPQGEHAHGKERPALDGASTFVVAGLGNVCRVGECGISIQALGGTQQPIDIVRAIVPSLCNLALRQCWTR